MTTVSVSELQLDAVREYMKNQEVHHRKKHINRKLMSLSQNMGL